MHRYLSMNEKSIYFLTGASGVGKTTLLNELRKKYSYEPWSFHHFDSIGVPTVDEMNKKFGSPHNWQKAKTFEWIEKLIYHDEHDKIFLEGQANLQYIKDAFALHQFTSFKLILIDCNEDVMTQRLGKDRNQPELVTADMKNWLKFLQKQAGELQVPIIDTSLMSKEQVIQTLEAFIAT